MTISQELQIKREIKEMEKRQFYAGLAIVGAIFISLMFS